MKRYTRGQQIRLTATFVGFEGSEDSPDEAVLRLDYQRGSLREPAVLSMTKSDDVFTATWDSSVADSGTVHWCVEFLGPRSTLEGSFELRANRANPGPRDAGP